MEIVLRMKHARKSKTCCVEFVVKEIVNKQNTEKYMCAAEFLLQEPNWQQVSSLFLYCSLFEKRGFH